MSQALPGNPALRQQLAEMYEEDQRIRGIWLAKQKALSGPDKDALWQEVLAIDRKHTDALKAIVARAGWPGKSLVGKDGADMAWTLAQRADHDRAFQHDVLARMEQLLAAGPPGDAEIEPLQHAYLYDHVAVGEHRPQRWGTQFPDGRNPAPIEDEAHVDERRTAAGLTPLAVYTAQMRALNAPKS